MKIRPPAALLDVDGVRLHYVERGSGESLVLLHGNGSMIEDLESTQPDLRVMVFDRPGFGHGDRHPRGKPRLRSRNLLPAKPTRDAHDRSAIGTSRRSFFGKASFFSIVGETASGSAFDREARAAAHRHLPFGTKVRATNVANNKSVVVTITDRGPGKRGRVLDLSLNAARTLGTTDRGVAETSC